MLKSWKIALELKIKYLSKPFDINFNFKIIKLFLDDFFFNLSNLLNFDLVINCGLIVIKNLRLICKTKRRGSTSKDIERIASV